MHFLIRLIYNEKVKKKEKSNKQKKEVGKE